MPIKQLTLDEAIRAAGMNQRQFAQKLDTGEAQVSRWVRGEVSPHPRLWRPRIARTLKLSVDQIAWPKTNGESQ